MPASLADSGSLLVIIAIICLTIGYVFGWLISSIQHGKEDKKQHSAEKTEAAGEADELVERISPAAAPEPVKPGTIFQLREGESAESLVVDFGGKSVNDPANLSMDDREQIESALRKTANWMGLAYQLGEPAPAVPVAVAAAAPAVSADTAEINDTLRAPSVISGMTNALADALQPTVKKETPRSIVEQIDEILQGMMAGTEYENQKIYLVEDPKKGVIVRVGTDVYEGVNALPEGEIKKMLRTAVAEWERRQEMNRRRATA